jgi:hypothetical protein
VDDEGTRAQREGKNMVIRDREGKNMMIRDQAQLQNERQEASTLVSGGAAEKGDYFLVRRAAAAAARPAGVSHSTCVAIEGREGRRTGSGRSAAAACSAARCFRRPKQVLPPCATTCRPSAASSNRRVPQRPEYHRDTRRNGSTTS